MLKLSNEARRRARRRAQSELVDEHRRTRILADRARVTGSSVPRSVTASAASSSATSMKFFDDRVGHRGGDVARERTDGLVWRQALARPEIAHGVVELLARQSPQVPRPDRAADTSSLG
jgi:hypothetical protein